MIRIFALSAGLAGSIMLANSALACVPDPRQSQQEGESVDAYQARIGKLERERSEWRQRGALKAPTLFIARAATADFLDQEAAERRASEPSPPAEPGEQPVVIPPPPLAVTGPRYFRPITWLRGTGSQDLVRIETRQTSCGYMSMGDTLFAKDGVDYVFAAREGPISENTLIDAIAIDRITEPELVALVARRQEDPGAGSETPRASTALTTGE